MAEPLALSYAWQPPALLTSVGAAIGIGGVVHTRTAGWPGVVAVLAVLWLAVLGLVVARTRAYLQVDGSRLTVRGVGRRHTIEAAQLVRVKQFLTRRGPSYRLVVREPGGRERGYVAPVALLRAGHSTLFEWILAQAPHAELDRGSTRTLDQLRIRGLVG